MEHSSQFADFLIKRNPVFEGLFISGFKWESFDGNDKEEAEKIFDEEKEKSTCYSWMTLEEFVKEWQADQAKKDGPSNTFDDEAESTCQMLNIDSANIFDVHRSSRRNLPYVQPSQSKGRPKEFNAYEFIMDAEMNNRGMGLDLKLVERENEYLEELEEDEEEEEMTFQESLNKNEYADNSIRYIANIAAILNIKKNYYPVLELCGETRVHMTH